MTTSNLRVVSSGPDGAIEVTDTEVIISKLAISNPELAAYLKQFDSPQEQVVAMVDLINLAISVKNLASSSLETENVKKSAEMVIQGLEGTAVTVKQVIETSTSNIFDPETGIVAVKLREASASLTEEQQKIIKQVLSLQDEASPLFQLQSGLKTVIDTKFEAVKTDINNVGTALNQFIGAQDKKKELHLKSREKGGDLEEILDEIIQQESAVHGDDARYTGDTASAYGKNVGDEVITINPSITGNAEVNIVWEAKTDMTFKDAKGRLKRDKVAKELNDALANRDAVYAIFVSDVNGLDLNVQPIWNEFEGNKLVIVIDPEDPDQRLVRMAYLWARAKALQTVSTNDDALDMEAIERVINNFQREFKTLKTLKDSHTKIREGISKATAYVEDFEGTLNGLLDELRDLVTPSENA
jgi:hypothetical protein